MNKSRELFLLFNCSNSLVMHGPKFIPEGYTLIHKHSFPNDEPPYVMVTFWGRGKVYSFDEEEESLAYYLIREVDADRFIAHKKCIQDDYLGYYLEGVLTRNAGEHNFSAHDCAIQGMNSSIYKNVMGRSPKIKFIYSQPMASTR